MTPIDCEKCQDAGVVELTQGSFVVLAKCFCKQGKKQGWDLETAPMRGFSEQPLDWKEYKTGGISNYNQAIDWHLERIKFSELFWAEQKKITEDETA